MQRSAARFSFKEALAQLPRGCPLGSKLLATHGITAKRASALVRSGWLQRLGRGAYQLPGDTLNRDDCLAFLAQQQPGLHVAAKTALAWRGVRHNLAYRETVVLWGDQPARIPNWLAATVPVRYRVAHIFDADLPEGLGLAPLAGGHPDLPVSTPERALLELLSETGSFESLEEVRQLVESTRNLRLQLLDQLLGHLSRIKVARLAARLTSDLQLPWADLAQQHSRRLGGGRRWVAVGRTGERLDLAATP
ncbi:MAG: type IV toxin-antitoxin system AbiEi family antitoxin domain-containing protein [Prochlorococcaceae cyanobacterium]